MKIAFILDARGGLVVLLFPYRFAYVASVFSHACTGISSELECVYKCMPVPQY